MIVETIKDWHPFGAYITSGDGEDSKPACCIIIYLWWLCLRLPFLPLVKPETKRVIPKWDAATIARLGRDYYIQYTRRDYGFLFGGGGYLGVYFGRQTYDSSTEQTWDCFLPWTQWRFIRLSLYDLAGNRFADEPPRKGFEDFEEWQKIKQRCPNRKFMFKDFDGEEIDATTMIVEREWLFGDEWCKWLSWFRMPKIRRSLDIEFSKETGPRKGSWKGGTIAHGINMLSGELHEAAFRRYCEEHKMTLLRSDKN